MAIFDVKLRLDVEVESGSSVLWKENCCGSSVTCRDPIVVEAVVSCVLCVSVAICCVVPVCCAVCCAVCCCSMTVAVGCCCCGRVVVVGAEGRAGSGWLLLPSAPGCFGGSCCCRPLLRNPVGGQEDLDAACRCSPGMLQLLHQHARDAYLVVACCDAENVEDSQLLRRRQVEVAHSRSC